MENTTRISYYGTISIISSIFFSTSTISGLIRNNTFDMELWHQWCSSRRISQPHPVSIICRWSHVLNWLPGIKFCIYAADLAIFTNTKSQRPTPHALQFAILFIQWFSAHLGLHLDMDKNKYQLFTRTNNRPRFKLYFDKTTPNRVMDKETFCEPSQDECFCMVKYAKEAIKYLGFYLDEKLNWRSHCKQILRQCQTIYHVIRQNLKMTRRISTSIIWCVYLCYYRLLCDYIWTMHCRI